MQLFLVYSPSLYVFNTVDSTLLVQFVLKGEPVVLYTLIIFGRGA